MWWRCLLVVLLLSITAHSQAAGLSVESFSPQGQVERLTQIVVRFNAPMHALGDMSQDAATSPLKISLSSDYQTPPPPGNYLWLDERTLAYLFDQPWREAMRLYCKVEAGAKPLAGATLSKEVKWVVSTPPIGILNDLESPLTLGNKADFTLTFSQPLDLASLKQLASLKVDDKTELPLNIREVPLPSWEDPESRLSRDYQFSSATPLKVGQHLTLIIKPGLKSPHGYLPTQNHMEVALFSFHPLEFTDWSMGSGPQNETYDPESSLYLAFNNPVLGRDLKQAMKLQIVEQDNKRMQASGDESEILRDVSLEGVIDNEADYSYYYLRPGFLPRTHYRLTLNAGLKDSLGSSLSVNRVTNFITGDFYPRFSTTSGEGVVESAFSGSQTIWLRNLKNFTVTAHLYSEEQAPEIYNWFNNNYWRDQPDSLPRPALPSQSKEITPPVKLNQPYPYQLDIADLLGQKLGKGVVLLEYRYRARMSWDNSEKLYTQRALLQYSDMGLSLKYGYSSGLVWVTSLSQAQPMGNVNLTLRDSKGAVLWRGKSDEKGMARIPGMIEMNAARDSNSSWGFPKLILSAEKDGQLAVLTSFSSNATLRYSADNYTDQSLNPGSLFNMHVITQLPLYMPGQTVNYLAYIRQFQDSAFTAPHIGQEVHVEISDPDGKVVHKATIMPNAYASLAGDFVLDEKARLGNYSVKASWDTVTVNSYNAFSVNHYRTPDYKVDVKLDLPDKADVQADYFFGAPVPDAPLKLNISQQQAYFIPEKLRDYLVGEVSMSDYYWEEEDGEEEQNQSLDKSLGVVEGKLDGKGHASLSLPPAQGATGKTLKLNVRAEVTDAAGMVVSGFASQYLHPCLYYLGIKTPYLAQAKQAFSVDMLAATPDNENAPTLEVEVSLYRNQWDVVRERGPEGFYQTVSKVNSKLVEQKTITLASSGGAAELTPPEAGEYIVKTVVKDAHGGQFTSSAFLWVYGEGLSAWQRFDDFRLELVTQNNVLNAGQTARLLVKNPFSRATALISVEREGVKRCWVEEFTSSAPIIEVPLEEGDAPNVYVSVLLVRGRVGEAPTSGPDLAKPQVRFGNIDLTVNNDKPLKVEVTPSDSKFKPGDEVSVEVMVSGPGAKQPYQVTLLAVDERVLSVAGNRDNYDPSISFKAHMPLKVLSDDSRTNVIDQRFSAGLKGEDTAGGGGGSQMPEIREDFSPMVYWLAQGQSDENGNLKASFKLPDSLTAYRIVAIAADKQCSFGVGKASITASKDLQVLSALPAFLVAGDKLKARFIIQNMSPVSSPAIVKITANGLELNDQEQKVIGLVAGQMQAVDFDCQLPIGFKGEVSLVVKAALGEASDAAKFTIPVMPAAQPLSAAAAGVTKAGQEDSVPFELPPGILKEQSQLNLWLATMPASGMVAPLDMLQNYPWMCLEQRTSKALGMAVAFRYGQMLGIPPAGDELDKISKILASFENFQADNGQFRFWEGARHSHSYFYPYLTAYVLMAGKNIKDMTGLGMDSAVEAKAYAFLDQALRTAKPGAISPQTEAMIIWLLAQRENPGYAAQVPQNSQTAYLKGMLNSALAKLAGQEPFTISYLMMAAKALGNGRLASDLVVRLDKGAVRTATHLHFNYVSSHPSRWVMGSQLRENALALWALVTAAPNYSDLESLVVWLSSKLGADSYLNTQEAAYSLIAMSAYLQKLDPKGDAAVKVSLADKNIVDHAFKSLQDPPLVTTLSAEEMPDGKAQMRIRAEKGPIYWATRLSYVPAKPDLKPVNAGFTVTRQLKLEGGDGSVSACNMGDVLECTVTVNIPESRLHVLVFAPLPAGLESFNAASITLPAESQGDEYVWQWVEMRKDGLLLYAADMAPGVYTYTYKLRAAASGRFIHRSTRAEEMYQPEVYGLSAGGEFEVK